MNKPTQLSIYVVRTLNNPPFGSQVTNELRDIYRNTRAYERLEAGREGLYYLDVFLKWVDELQPSDLQGYFNEHQIMEFFREED